MLSVTTVCTLTDTVHSFHFFLYYNLSLKIFILSRVGRCFVQVSCGDGHIYILKIEFDILLGIFLIDNNNDNKWEAQCENVGWLVSSSQHKMLTWCDMDRRRLHKVAMKHDAKWHVTMLCASSEHWERSRKWKIVTI